jgi:hypothetical protein
VIQLLNQTLACTVDLRSHVKQAGWNVKGQDFVPLQALSATITLQVDAEVAKALTAASPQEQRKIQLLLCPRLQDLTSAHSCTIGVAIPCAFHLWWALSFHVVPARQTGGRDPPM